MSLKKCQHCGAAGDKGDLFCQECGAKYTKYTAQKYNAYYEPKPNTSQYRGHIQVIGIIEMIFGSHVSDARKRRTDERPGVL